ncbi:MAG: alpha/beta fold hydrolase [Solirubrobacteraceae bacterium]
MTSDGVLSSVTVQGEGRTLVLLHGGPGLVDYMGLLDSETEGWRRVRYQQRGHPPSAVSGPFTVQQHLDDLISVLDGVGTERCVVLGHSWGGHLALQAALAVPGRIDGVLLVDPFGSVADGGAIAMAETLAARLLPHSRQRAAEVGEQIAAGNHSNELGTEFLALQWPGYFTDPEHAPPLPPGLSLNLTCNGETMASVFDELQSGFAERLGDCEPPVELIVGQGSPIPFAVSEQTAALLPNSRLTITPDAGHLPWHERPGCVRAALARL